MTSYRASKALMAIAGLIGLAACHAGFGIGDTHAGFRVGDDGGRPPLASNPATSAVAQTSTAEAVTATE
jgi:hypothetical protein